MRWKPLHGAFGLSCFLHGLVWLLLGLNLDLESADCCGVLHEAEIHTHASSLSQVLQVRLEAPPVAVPVQAVEVSTLLEKTQSSPEVVVQQSTFVPSKAQPQPPSEVVAASTEFGAINTHFYEKSELNRFPVLLQAVQFAYETLTPEDLQVGQVDVWLYISASGRVVAVRTESNSLTPATLQVIFNKLKDIKFTPGYSSGDPVPSKIRWQVIVDSRTIFTSKPGSVEVLSQ